MQNNEKTPKVKPGKLHFLFQHPDGVTKVEMGMLSTAPLDEILDNINIFLLASGYTLNGFIDIIDEPEDDDDPSFGIN